jgi:hypothetical protein
VPAGGLKQRQARAQAEAIARKWVDEQDSPSSSARGEFILYLQSFWNFDSSAYVRGQINRGKTISRRYCGVLLDAVRKYIEPTSKGWMIEALDAEAFDAWMARLSSRRTPARTINPAPFIHMVTMTSVEKETVTA